MTCRIAIGVSRRVALVLMLSVMMVSPSLAADVYLVARAFTKIVPPGTPVSMWGFAEDADGDLGTVGTEVPTVPGPMITVPPGDTVLNIFVRNELPDPISVVIPGLAGALTPVRGPGGRMRSFTNQTAAGAAGVYSWTNLKSGGTLLYLSGTHPAVQVQMGLYGGVRIDAAPGQVYPGVPYDSEVVLFYSEIDTGLHAAVAGGTYGTAPYTSTVNYKADYSLINGQPFSAGQPPIPAGEVGQRVLIRFLNAGLKSHAPQILNTYLRVIAEDANLYPFERETYSVLLPAGKTVDAIWNLNPTPPGVYPFFDGFLNMTNAGALDGGMQGSLEVAACIPCSPTVAVTASAKVEAKKPDTVFPQDDLSADADSEKYSVLRVQVSGTNGKPVTSAMLGLTVQDVRRADSDSGGMIQNISNCSVDLSTLTYNIAQGLALLDGTPEQAQGPVNRLDRVWFDISKWITGDGTFCFAITSQSANGVDYYGLGTGINQPEATIAADCACASTTTTTTMSTTTTTVAPPTTTTAPPTTTTTALPTTTTTALPTTTTAAPTTTTTALPTTTTAAPTTTTTALPTTTTAPPTTTTTTVTPTTTTTLPCTPTATIVADAKTEEKKPDRNFGADDQLSADRRSEKNALLKINLSCVGGQNVSLRVTVAEDDRAHSNSGGNIQKTSSCAWTEAGVTFNNQPTFDGTPGPDMGAVEQGDQVTFDLGTPGDGTHCYAIRSNSRNGVDYNSRESAVNPPELIIGP